jgi:hypothetical protein
MIKKFACFLVMGLAGAAPLRPQTVDCLVAVVGGQAVTLTDLEVAQEFGLFDGEVGGARGDQRLAVLDALIGQKVVLEMAREPVSIGQDEIAQALAALRDKLGAEAFRTKLRKLGMRESDLGPYIEERLRYGRAVSTRFATMAPVTRGDIEKFYREVYVPEQKGKGLEPDGLESVLSIIETRIRENVRARKVADWVRTLRSQSNVRVNRDCLK